MTKFIELTELSGEKVIINVACIHLVQEDANGRAYILLDIGTGMETHYVKESYEELLNQLMKSASDLQTLSWHKYPDEKPPADGDNGIITITKNSNGSVSVDARSYDDCMEQFYWDACDGGGWSPFYISDIGITHWLHINELPLPQQEVDND